MKYPANFEFLTGMLEFARDRVRASETHRATNPATAKTADSRQRSSSSTEPSERISGPLGRYTLLLEPTHKRKKKHTHTHLAKCQPATEDSSSRSVTSIGNPEHARKPRHSSANAPTNTTQKNATIIRGTRNTGTNFYAVANSQIQYEYPFPCLISHEIGGEKETQNSTKNQKPNKKTKQRSQLT